MSEASTSSLPKPRKKICNSAATANDDDDRWEQQQVLNMLNEVDDDDSEDDDVDEVEEALEGGERGGDSTEEEIEEEEEVLPSPAASDVSSDITDPFEEFHSHGALQTEESLPAPTRQPLLSRRSQFLRAVSLFSPAQQLAVFEAREEQGVSLLERSTCLTAEALDQIPQMISEVAERLHKGSSAATTPRTLTRGSGTPSMLAAVEELDLAGVIREQTAGGADESEAAEDGQEDQEKRSEDTWPPFPRADRKMDPVLIALLSELWTDPRRTPQGDGAAVSAPKASRRPSRIEADWPDVLSGLWRMLDTYEEFKCSPPGYNAFRQEKPHWLDQEPIPWKVAEKARQKCMQWLQNCPCPNPA